MLPLYSAKTSSVFAVKAVRDSDDLLPPTPDKDLRNESKENRVVVEFLVAPNAAARETIAVDLAVSNQSLEVISSIAESIRLAARIVDMPCNIMHTTAFVQASFRTFPTKILGYLHKKYQYFAWLVRQLIDEITAMSCTRIQFSV